MSDITVLDRQFEFTPVLSTDEYIAGDVLFPTRLIAKSVFLFPGQASGEWKTLEIINRDNTVADIQVYLMRSEVSIGDANDEASMDDPDEVIAMSHWQTLWYDCAGHKYSSNAQGDMLCAPEGSKSVWVAAVIHSTQTFSADALTFRLTFRFM